MRETRGDFCATSYVCCVAFHNVRFTFFSVSGYNKQKSRRCVSVIVCCCFRLIDPQSESKNFKYDPSPIMETENAIVRKCV